MSVFDCSTEQARAHTAPEMASIVADAAAAASRHGLPSLEHAIAGAPIEAAREIAWDIVKRLRKLRETGTAPTPIGAVQCDDRSKLKITGLVQMALIAQASAQPFEVEFTLADNSVALLDIPIMLAVGVATGEFVDSVYSVARSLRSQIDAADTIGALLAVDIFGAPWPATGAP